MTYNQQTHEVTFENIDYTYAGNYTFEITLVDSLSASRSYLIQAQIVIDESEVAITTKTESESED